MANTVSIDQLKTLWTDGGQIDRGPDFSPVTQDDLGALASGLDTDGDGLPADDGQWQVLANQINEAEAGETDGSWQQDTAVQAIEETRARRDELKADLAAAQRDLDDAIRAAVAARVPVTHIAAVAGLSCERVYQIRDDRR